SRETISRRRRRKIVAARFGESEKFGRHHHANRVAADIIRTRVAAAIAEKPGHGFDGTNFQRAAQHIHGWKLPARASAISGGFVEHSAGSRLKGRVALQYRPRLCMQITA